MSEQSHPAWDSAVVGIVIAGVCAVVGLVALPLVFGAAPLRALTVAGWLVGAVLLSVVLVVLVPRLSAALSESLRPGIANYSDVTPSQTRLVSRLLILGLMLVISQAILRRPLAMVISGEPSAASVEAGIAALVLAVVLALLVWLYQTARPVVQAVTLRAIDAAIPTVGEAPLAEPTRTMSVMTAPTAMGQPLVPATAADEPALRTPATDLPTVPATDLPTVADGGLDGPTRPSTHADEPTLRIPPSDPDATLRSDP
jgi:hypothetical protein